jgi:hypothetical protein
MQWDGVVRTWRGRPAWGPEGQRRASIPLAIGATVLHGVRSGWLPVCMVSADVSARDEPGRIGNVISLLRARGGRI